MSNIDESWVRREISRQLNIILSGESGTNDSQSETISNLYPGMPNIPARPVMHPYGVVSRAPAKTISVTARTGDHPGNRMTLGHRDKDRPADIEVGETAVYSLGKYQVRLLNGKIQLGKNGEFETMVVGDTMVEFLTALLDHIIAHTHVCSVPGSQGAPPFNLADFQNDKANYVANKKILAEDGGRY